MYSYQACGTLGAFHPFTDVSEVHIAGNISQLVGGFLAAEEIAGKLLLGLTPLDVA